MDERIRRHAEILAGWSGRVEPGDRVIVNVSPETQELAVALADELGDRGAIPTFLYGDAEVRRAYLQAHDGDFDPAEQERALYESADLYLSLGGSRNRAALSDVDPETRRSYRTSQQAVREALRDLDTMSTTHPTRALAQRAGMSFEGYQDFVYNAILRDWESIAEEMSQLKTLIDDGDEIRIRNERSDLTMDISDRTAVNSCASVAYDSGNLPSGEVYTAPAATEGEIVFDFPMTVNGQRVENVRFVIEDNTVVEAEAETGESAVTEVLATDEGARRIGELGIGMNRGIDRITDSIAFDEKMAESVHLAVGRAYDECLPEGERGNQSAIHQDFIADMSGDSALLIDGELVQANGTFRWEEGFES